MATWYPAYTGQPSKASQINQFLTFHPTQILYDGVAQVTNNTVSGSHDSSTWLAQSFVLPAGVTTVGRVELVLGQNGSPTPLLVYLYNNTAGKPSGAPIVGAGVPVEAGTISIPLPATGLTAGGTYWIVTKLNGTSTDGWTWASGAASSGACISSDGINWTVESFSLGYVVYDQAVTGNVRNIVCDSDPTSRWQGIDYSQGLPTTLRDSVDSAGLHSIAALAYSGPNLTSVSVT